LVLPAIYWLCIELFDSSTVAWIAVALLTVSPVHIIHAQNARPQSLWILMIVLSSAALLQAMRLNKKLNWVTYGVTLVLSLYTYLFSIFVLIAHGIYVIFREKFRLTKTLTAYLLASSLAILGFTPWLFVIIINKNTATTRTDWLKAPAPFRELIQSWIKNLCDIFIYWHYEYEEKLLISEDIFIILLGVPLIILVLYSTYLLCRRTPRKEWLFILALTGVTALALVFPDVVFGGRRSALSRYIFPSILGIQVTVAYFLTTKISSISSRNLRVKIWQIILIALIYSGVLSCTISSQTETWEGRNDFIIQASNIINKAPSPLVISDDDIIAGLMPLNYRLAPHVRLLLMSKSTVPVIPDGFSDVFLFSASQELQAQLEEKLKIRRKPVYQDSYLGSFVWKQSLPTILWKLEK
jgi:uncharacterized membrane protein